MYFTNHAINLCFEDTLCTLAMMFPDADSLYISRFENAEALLTVLLNRHYYPELIDDDQLTAMGFQAGAHPEDTPWYAWLDSWNHTGVDNVVQEIYFSGNGAVEALKPSQRFQVMLALERKPFAAEFIEDSFAHPRPILHAAETCGRSFWAMTEQCRAGKNLTAQQARFQAGCQLVGQCDVSMPRQVQYWFADMDQLIRWLLRDVIRRDRYIKRCGLCGRYFIPKRNTKQYCSAACTNHQRELDSFCGVQEARRLYMRIVSNLRDKAQRMERLQQPYHVRGETETWYEPQAVLKQFYSGNADHMKKLRQSYKAMQTISSPTEEQRAGFEAIRETYLDWLRAQYRFATSLELDRDA